MALSHGPSIVTNGLVLALDAADINSYDKYENLLQYSEDFSNAYWAKSNVSVTSNAITSPSGSSNASKLVESASTSTHELFRVDSTLFVGTDTYITFSIFAKAAERQYCYIRSAGNSKRIAVVVDLSNGTFNVTNWGFTLNSSATVTPYPNGWYRITATAQSNLPAAAGWAGHFIVSPIDSYQSAVNVGGSGYSYTGNGTSGIYIWGAHYEFGPGILDYYATTGTAKTRGTIWTDLSGNGNNGTLMNGPTFNSSNRGSIVFDGVDDGIVFSGNNISGLSELATEFTISAWVKYSSSFTSGFRAFMTKQSSISSAPGTPRLDIGYFIDNSTFYFTTYNSSSGVIDPGNFSYSLSNLRNWSNYVLICGNGLKRAYINNILLLSNNFTSTYPDNTHPLLIGGDRKLNGNMAQVSIYNRALTAAEVQQNFNALRGRFNI